MDSLTGKWGPPRLKQCVVEDEFEVLKEGVYGDGL
jgi:hypothetical protein